MAARREYSLFLRGLGVSRVTGWRWEKQGWVKLVNICGQNYITDKEAKNFSRPGRAR